CDRLVVHSALAHTQCVSSSTVARHYPSGTISPRALEVLLHRLEVAALPSAVAVAGVTVGHIAVPDRDHRAARRRLQQHLDLRIRVSIGEYGGSPRLHDTPARLELEVPSRDVPVPHRERGAVLRRDLRLLPAGDVFVAAAAEPGVVDVLRPSGIRSDTENSNGIAPPPLADPFNTDLVCGPIPSRIRARPHHGPLERDRDSGRRH